MRKFFEIVTVALAVVLVVGSLWKIATSTEEQTNGYVEYSFGPEGRVCERHIVLENGKETARPCPKDWTRYEQVRVASLSERRDIEASITQ